MSVQGREAYSQSIEHIEQTSESQVVKYTHMCVALWVRASKALTICDLFEIDDQCLNVIT